MNEGMKRIGAILVRLIRDIKVALQIVIFLTVALFAVAAISELSARDRYAAQINLAIEKIEGGPSETDIKRPAELALIDLKYKKEALDRLIQIGATSYNDTLIAMSTKKEGPGIFRDAYFEIPHIHISYRSSDFLLAIAIIACAALGAGVTSMREGTTKGGRALFLGVSSGFLVFLIVRGGAHVLLLAERAAFPQFNPYTCGLIGFLSGSFTARVQEILVHLVDSFVAQVKKVFKTD